MTTITNNTAGPRIASVVDAANPGQPKAVTLLPGQAITATLADPSNPIYRAWQSRGEVDFGGALPAGPTLTTTVVTNNGPGPRGINVVDPIAGQGMATVILKPGESRALQLFDPTNPIYRGLQNAGEVDFGGALP